MSLQNQCGECAHNFINPIKRRPAQVHPIPPYENLTALNLMVDEMEKLGLWLIYDMRW